MGLENDTKVPTQHERRRGDRAGLSADGVLGVGHQAVEQVLGLEPGEPDDRHHDQHDENDCECHSAVDSAGRVKQFACGLMFAIEF